MGAGGSVPCIGHGFTCEKDSPIVEIRSVPSGEFLVLVKDTPDAAWAEIVAITKTGYDAGMIADRWEAIRMIQQRKRP